MNTIQSNFWFTLSNCLPVKTIFIVFVCDVPICSISQGDLLLKQDEIVQNGQVCVRNLWNRQPAKMCKTLLQKLAE